MRHTKATKLPRLLSMVKNRSRCITTQTTTTPSWSRWTWRVPTSTGGGRFTISIKFSPLSRLKTMFMMALAFQVWSLKLLKGITPPFLLTVRQDRARPSPWRVMKGSMKRTQDRTTLTPPVSPKKVWESYSNKLKKWNLKKKTSISVSLHRSCKSTMRRFLTFSIRQALVASQLCEKHRLTSLTLTKTGCG